MAKKEKLVNPYLAASLSIAEEAKGKGLSKSEVDKIQKAQEMLGSQLSKESIVLIVALG